MKPGSAYEQFVASLSKALIDSEDIFKQKNIVVEVNKKLVDNLGLEREFDIYWEYELFGILYKTVIECKDYSNRISIDKIDALVGKLKDLPNIKPLYATTIGYQKGAKDKAIKSGVELLVVRKQQDKDWYDKDGNPYLKKIHINIVLESNIQVTLVCPVLDKKWIEENTNFDLGTLAGYSRYAMNDVIIRDHKNNRSKSIEEYFLELNNKKELPGIYQVKFDFEDGYIVLDNTELKIDSLNIEYTKPQIDYLPINIDYSQQLYGVIEYLNSKIKKRIFINGKISSEEM